MTLSIDEFVRFYCGSRPTRMEPVAICPDCLQPERYGEKHSHENPAHYIENGLRGLDHDNGKRERQG